MKWILIVGVVLVGLIALMAIVGAALPKNHVVGRSAEFKEAPPVLWAVITNVEAYPEWRAGLKKVEVLSNQPEKRWREESSNGVITYEVTEAIPPNRLVTRIADPKLPFGGSWTYQINPSSAGSTLTIIENGEVYNVFFRFLSRFVFGYITSIDACLNSLGKKLGDKITISSKS